MLALERSRAGKRSGDQRKYSIRSLGSVRGCASTGRGGGAGRNGYGKEGEKKGSMSRNAAFREQAAGASAGDARANSLSAPESSTDSASRPRMRVREQGAVGKERVGGRSGRGDEHRR